MLLSLHDHLLYIVYMYIYIHVTTSSTASLVLQNISLSTFQFRDKGLGMLICHVEENRNHRNVACHFNSACLVRPPA